MFAHRSIYVTYIWIYFSFPSSFSLWLIVYLFFCLFFRTYVLLFLDDNVNEESKQFSNSKSSVWGCRLASAWFFFCNFSLALLIKVFILKKLCIALDFGQVFVYWVSTTIGWCISQLRVGFEHGPYRVLLQGYEKAMGNNFNNNIDIATWTTILTVLEPSLLILN